MLVVREKQIENIKQFTKLAEAVIRQERQKSECNPAFSFLAETMRYIQENVEAL